MCSRDLKKLIPFSNWDFDEYASKETCDIIGQSVAWILVESGQILAKMKNSHFLKVERKKLQSLKYILVK